MSMGMSDEDQQILDSSDEMNYMEATAPVSSKDRRFSSDIFAEIAQEKPKPLLQTIKEDAKKARIPHAVNAQNYKLLKEAGVENIDVFDEKRNYVAEVRRRLKEDNEKSKLLETLLIEEEERRRLERPLSDLAAEVQGPMSVDDLKEASDFLDSVKTRQEIAKENEERAKRAKKEQEEKQRQEEAEKLRNARRFAELEKERERNRKLGITEETIDAEQPEDNRSIFDIIEDEEREANAEANAENEEEDPRDKIIRAIEGLKRQAKQEAA